VHRKKSKVMHEKPPIQTRIFGKRIIQHRI
jgi:hypothetical protein